MELTPAALDYLLRQRYETVMIGSTEMVGTAERLRLQNNHVLLLSDAGESTALTLLTPGEEPAGEGWYLRCGERSEGQNAVLEAFQGFQLWRCSLLSHVGEEGDIQSVLEAASEYLGLSMAFVDNEYRYLGLSGKRAQDFPFAYDREQMSAEQVKGLFENNPDFNETFQGKELRFYPADGRRGETPGVGAYYCNVLVEGSYAGRILIPHSSEPLDSGLEDLIEVLMEVLHSCCVLRRYRTADRQPHDVWRELLETGDVDAMAAGNMLLTLRWQVKQRYQALCLRPLGYLYDAHTMKYLAAELEEEFPACIVVYREGSLFCLHNLSREEDEDFQSRFALFLRENLFRCGVSGEFGDFYDSRLFSEQARETLTLGEMRDPSLWRYEYGDYLYEAALSHAAGGYPVEYLCSPALRELLSYEEAHPETRLTETLYQYIACRFNAVQAAERMHMHRTTFIHHMDKIRQIADFHLEDPKEHLTVFLALSALREAQSRLGTD